MRVLLLLVITLTVPAPSAPHRYPLRQYMAIRRSDDPSFSPDGSRIAMSSNASGSWQPYTVPAAGGEPRQLTRMAGTSHIEWSPKDDSILVVADREGDQRYQFLLVSAASGKQVPLTHGDDQNEFGAWSHDGATIAYASNARDPKYFDVYVMDVATRRSTLVCQRNSVLHATAISWDGRRIAVEDAHSEVDNDLLVVDVGTREARLVTPHQGHARFAAIGFSRDGGTLYYRTNDQREFMAVVAQRLASGSTRTVVSSPHDVDYAVLDPDGRWLAIAENVDGFERLSVWDPETGRRLDLPSLPHGIAIPMRFSADGTRLAVMLNTPVHDDDIWIVDCKSRRLQRVTHSDMAGIAEQGLVVAQTIRYPSFDGRSIPALFYAAPGSSRERPAPVLVSIHGGPEEQEQPYLTHFYQYFASRGYAILAPNVRGSTGYGKSYVALDNGPLRWNALKDLTYAVRWIRGRPELDGRRVACFGFSYGGFATLTMLAHYPRLFAAGVDFYGPADLASFLNRTAEYRRPLRIAEYGDPVRDSTFMNAISPARHADRIVSPLLVIQGANDPIVPKAESEDIVRLVKAHGGTVEYLLFPDEGHGLAKQDNFVKAFETMDAFLGRALEPRADSITDTRTARSRRTGGRGR
jgi:dipeptidyl aminopeptidase/acylaminoacyl peptidase